MEHLDPLLINANSYVEPFFGGGSIGLTVAQKYPNINLFINDKDLWISSFWRVVSGNEYQLQELLTLIDQPATIEHFYHLWESDPSNDVERAYHAIFFNRCCFSGIVKKDKYGRVKSSPIGGRDQRSEYTVGCRYNAKKLKEKIIICNRLLAGRTRVDCMDINDYLGSIEKDAPMYLDPPYARAGHMLYNEYMEPAEHIKLAGRLRAMEKWVLSYDDCSEIRGLYENNRIIDLAARYSINGSKEKWVNKNELLILP